MCVLSNFCVANQTNDFFLLKLNRHQMKQNCCRPNARILNWHEISVEHNEKNEHHYVCNKLNFNDHSHHVYRTKNCPKQKWKYRKKWNESLPFIRICRCLHIEHIPLSTARMKCSNHRRCVRMWFLTSNNANESHTCHIIIFNILFYFNSCTRD